MAVEDEGSHRFFVCWSISKTCACTENTDFSLGRRERERERERDSFLD